MPLLSTLLAIVICLAAAGIFAELVLAGRRVGRLNDRPPLDADLPHAPRVSIIVAARDEAPRIESALRSLLAQRYPSFEVIAVDDRSTDDTGAILERVCREDARLRVLRIDVVPDGWLGKNHALHRGAEVATGELLLFVDADVHLDPTALSRAVGVMRESKADHLTIIPELVAPTRTTRLVVEYFWLSYQLYAQPWKVHDPRSRAHAGVGAFNLVRAELYRHIGGHTAIALRPDDDIKLGKLVKQRGGSQRALHGRGLVRVEWYPSVRAFVRGMRKNSFASLDYSIPKLVGALAGGAVLQLWPFVALLVTTGPLLALYSVTALLLITPLAVSMRRDGAPIWLALGYPLAAAVMLYAMAGSAAAALRSGGIEWRGTRYPLDALRANRV
jgi:glycosyltransferase involved in cell wall biosynthesis